MLLVPANRRLQSGLSGGVTPLAEGTPHEKPHKPLLLLAAFARFTAGCQHLLSIYDHQCAACRLRIKLPVGNDVSFIDAAHLIPFSKSQKTTPATASPSARTTTGRWIVI